jgi:hypothetical protein
MKKTCYKIKQCKIVFLIIYSYRWCLIIKHYGVPIVEIVYINQLLQSLRNTEKLI